MKGPVWPTLLGERASSPFMTWTAIRRRFIGISESPASFASSNLSPLRLGPGRCAAAGPPSAPSRRRYEIRRRRYFYKNCSHIFLPAARRSRYTAGWKQKRPREAVSTASQAIEACRQGMGYLSAPTLASKPSTRCRAIFPSGAEAASRFLSWPRCPLHRTWPATLRQGNIIHSYSIPALRSSVVPRGAAARAPQRPVHILSAAHVV